MNTLTGSTISLTQELIRFDTVNPPGNEAACAAFLAERLADGGFRVDSHEFAPGRPSLVARLDDGAESLPLCFTGHIDTVPLGTAPWTKDPFAAEIEGDKLFGRGASDMKSGVAAIVIAALELSKVAPRRAGIKLIITAGEETSCQGAFHLAQHPEHLGRGGALIVAEPTSNYPYIGHRGVLWLEARSRGKAAHGSMPEQGDNAIYKAARAITSLENIAFRTRHPILGEPSLNVGTFTGGQNINSVPDDARFTIDLRTVPGQTAEALEGEIQSRVGDAVGLRRLQAHEAVASDPAHPWIRQVFAVVANLLGRPITPKGAPYFTDASALTPALGNPPTVILGPGELEQAHKTDEFCFLRRIEQALQAYLEIGKIWLAGEMV